MTYTVTSSCLLKSEFYMDGAKRVRDYVEFGFFYLETYVIVYIFR